VRDEQIHFQVGGVEVPFDQVKAVYATPESAPAATPTS
jgi:hypothetical protein